MMETSIADKSISDTGMNFGPLFIAIAATTWTFDFWSRNYLVGVVGIQPSLLVMFEHIIITIFIIPILIRSSGLITQFNWKEWLALFIIGAGASALATVSLTAGYSLGFTYAPVVALTQQLQPVIAIGLAHLLLKETLPSYYYPLSLVAITGVFLMYWPLISVFSVSILDNIGVLAAFLGLLAATLWGSGTVLGKYLLVHSDTDIEYLEMASYRFVVGMIALVIFNSFFSTITYEAFEDPAAIGNILFIALVPGLLSLILYYYGLKSTHASVATLFELAFPLSFFILIPVLNATIAEGTIDIKPIQFIGAIILIIATTSLSYIYGKQTSPDQFEDLKDIN